MHVARTALRDKIAAVELVIDKSLRRRSVLRSVARLRVCRKAVVVFGRIALDSFTVYHLGKGVVLPAEVERDGRCPA